MTLQDHHQDSLNNTAGYRKWTEWPPSVQGSRPRRKAHNNHFIKLYTDLLFHWKKGGLHGWNKNHRFLRIESTVCKDKSHSKITRMCKRKIRAFHSRILWPKPCNVQMDNMYTTEYSKVLLKSAKSRQIRVWIFSKLNNT